MKWPTTAAEAVASGAQWLDEQHPGWWRHIDLETLDLSSCIQCVCGQLSRTAYAWSRKGYRTKLGNFAVTRGFEVRYGYWSYEDLEAEWLLAIVARLKVDALPQAATERETIPHTKAKRELGEVTA